jgi:Nif-specific regulatory protein
MENNLQGNGRRTKKEAESLGLPFTEDLPTALRRVEREMITAALKAAGGNKARAARALGISERLMGLRVKKYKIDPQAFRTLR